MEGLVLEREQLRHGQARDMAMNEDYRQIEIASEVEERARTLAHSTRTVPTPSDSYEMLGEIRSSIEHLEQVCRQLSVWHARSQDYQHVLGEDGRGNRPGAIVTAAALDRSADALITVYDELSSALQANGTVRWTA